MAAEVNGLQMPRKIRYSLGYDGGELVKPTIPVQIEYNVEYDPSTFEKAPRTEAGPDAWRPKATHLRQPGTEGPRLAILRFCQRNDFMELEALERLSFMDMAPTAGATRRLRRHIS